jgi:hypothetical protein
MFAVRTNPIRLKVFLPFAVLCLAALGVLVYEGVGGVTRLDRVSLRGDLGRELRWLGQYGQFACVAIVALCIWQLDVPRRRTVAVLFVAVVATSAAAAAGKRLAGRVRPGFERAGQFLGPAAAADGAGHQSFPSGHTASAVAMTVVLAAVYPRVRGLLWALAAACGLLRWVRDAHWLSDVLAGAAVGYAIAELTLLAAARFEHRRGAAGRAGGADGHRRTPEGAVG